MNKNNEGYFSISRKIQESWIHPQNQNRKFSEFEAWFWLIQNAYYFCTEKKLNGKIITVPRGYLDKTVEQLSIRWRWDRRTTEKFIKLLEKEEMVKRYKINPKSKKSCTLIKLNNYNALQPKIDKQCTSKYKSKCKLNCTLEYTPNKKGKSKKGNKINLLHKLIQSGFEIQKDFIPLVEEWLEYKNSKKKRYQTERSLRAFLNKLMHLSDGDLLKAKQVLEQSYANNWDGIFELKEYQCSKLNTQRENFIEQKRREIEARKKTKGLINDG